MARFLALVPALLWGVAAGWWTPRGPASAVEAVATILLSAAAGFLGGRIGRTRWTMIFAPVAFAAAVEATRLGYVGPTVDHPHLSSLGILALLAGRGFHGLLTLLPMLVGAAYGAGSVRRIPGRWRPLRRFVTGVLAFLVVLIGVGVALPGRAEPITGGISELVSAGPFGLMIRGADAKAPVLLFVPGSPGGSEMGAMRTHLAALEKSFVVATLDRRGGGRSFRAMDPTATFTVEDEMRTVLGVTDFLRSRFQRDKIFLLAHSGGTIGATLAAQAEPARYLAYVGVGQVSNPTTSDRTQYDDTVAWARAKGDNRLVDQLTAVGPPPYGNLYSYEPMVINEGHVYGSDSSGSLTENLGAPEQSLLDKVHVATGFLDAYDVYYPRVRGVDFRSQVPRLDVPVYFVAGENEVPSRTRDLNLWVAGLTAPHKEVVTLRNAGHRSMFQQPAAFVDVMRRVLTENR